MEQPAGKLVLWHVIPQGDIVAVGESGAANFISALSTNSAGALRANDDHSSALALQESWVEVWFSYGDHDHDDDDQHNHDHGVSENEDSTGGHCDGCGCAVCRPDNGGGISNFRMGGLNFDTNRLDQIRRRFSSFAHSGQGPLQRDFFRVNVDHQSVIENEFRNWFDKMRQRRFDSFFGSDLLL